MYLNYISVLVISRKKDISSIFKQFGNGVLYSNNKIMSIYGFAFINI